MSGACISLPVTADSVTRVGAWLDAEARRLGLADEVRDAMRVCAEEAATNIVRHAFPPGALPGAAGAPTFRARLEANGDVRLAFEDDGVPFDPTRYADKPTPGSVDDAHVGGLGIRLMRGFARMLRYERRGGINRLVMSFERRTGG
ncbi:MAG: ATP-binding protein [Alphaproteobacteria bacterium]|nr:ATP-binding protein [Alphaproteobacteria bacterium]